MRRVLARRQASTQSKQAVKPHHSRLALKDQELPIAKPVDGVLLAALRRKLEAQGVSDTHDAGGRQLQPGQQQQHDRRPVLQQTKHRRLGSANAIHSLLAAQRMVQQLQAGQQYRSRLAQAQVRKRLVVVVWMPAVAAVVDDAFAKYGCRPQEMACACL